MKKIFFMTLTMVFVLALGAAYAGDNGVTDFTGRSYDTGGISPAVAMNSVEGAAKGGIRLVERGDEALNNGITDFSGRSFDTFEIKPALTESNVAEGAAAGGLRQNLAGEKTSVRSYDTFEIER